MSVRFRFIALLMISIQLLLLPMADFNFGRSFAARSFKPRLSAEITPQILQGLQGKVEVLQDEFGIPHIFADKTEDLFFMQGFLHARDRFFQMDVTRRTVEGTLAELLGP